MAGPLTWRNVDAPNFSGALDGYRTAAQLLGNAVRSGQDAVGTFTQAGADVADRNVLNRMLGVQDSSAFQQGLADRSILGSDAGRVSLDTLRGLDTRVGTLLNRDVTRENLGQTQYTNTRGREADALLDAASPVLSQARQLARDNNQAGLTQLLRSSPELASLRPDQLSTLLTSTDQLGANSQARRASDASFISGQFDFGRKLTDTADGDTTQAALNQFQLEAADPVTASRSAERLMRGMSEGAKARFMRGTQGLGYNLFGPVGGGSGASGGASGGNASTATLPRTGGTLMDRFVDGLAKLETSGGSKTIKGPAGEDSFNLFNIKGPGFRARDLAEGSNDTYRTYATAEESRADLMDLLERRYPAALTAKTGAEFAKALKDGGYATDPNYVTKLTKVIGDTSDVTDQPKDRASTLLDQATKAATNEISGTAVKRLLNERASQNLSASSFQAINALQGDVREPIQVVDSLIREGGPLAGTERRAVLSQINNLIDRSGRNGSRRINAAQAAQILTSNLEDAGSPFWNNYIAPTTNFVGDVALGYFPRAVNSAATTLADSVGLGKFVPNDVRNPTALRNPEDRPPIFAGNVTPNQDRVQSALDNYLTGNSSTQVAAQDSLTKVAETQDRLEARYNEANAAYQAMKIRAELNPRLAERARELKVIRDEADAALSQVRQSVANSNTLTPRHDRPVATTRGTSGQW